MKGIQAAGQSKAPVALSIQHGGDPSGSDEDDDAPGPILQNDGNIALIRGTMLELVRRDGRDLTARQLTTLLSIYLENDVHSVTTVAQMLKIARPGVTRILDRLVEADLVRRSADPNDRRRVLITRTPAGTTYVGDLIMVANQVAAQLEVEMRGVS